MPIRQVGCVLLASMCAENPLKSSEEILANDGIKALVNLIKNGQSPHVPQLLSIFKALLENTSKNRKRNPILIIH